MPSDNNFNDIMKRAQEMQKKLHEIQKQVSETEIIGQAGGEMVKINFDGRHYAKKVILHPHLLKEDKAVMEDLIAAAINDGADKIEKHLRSKMGGLAGIALPDGLGDTLK